jgi:hypothetical protein
VWVHGDWALHDRDDHWFLLGRSDDTLKIAGKRLGPAEVETAASQCVAVKESAAIGVPHPTKGEVPVLFAVLMPGWVASARLAGEIADQVTAVLGKPLRPQSVYFVADLPKTRNAKIMRRVVRAVHLGKPAGDLSALENPTAIDGIPARAEGTTAAGRLERPRSSPIAEGAARDIILVRIGLGFVRWRKTSQMRASEWWPSNSNVAVSTHRGCSPRCARWRATVSSRPNSPTTPTTMARCRSAASKPSRSRTWSR